MSDRKIRRVCSRNVPWIFQSSHIFAFPFLLGYLAAVPAVVIASRRIWHAEIKYQQQQVISAVDHCQTLTRYFPAWL